jgi:hypothetical protein
MALSFIISLTFISRLDRERRLAEHEYSTSHSTWSWLSWNHWVSPEPYRQFKDQTTKSHQDPDNTAWVIHNKKAAVGKIQLEDAWELHGKVMSLILLGLILLLGGVYYISKLAWIRWMAK